MPPLRTSTSSSRVSSGSSATSHPFPHRTLPWKNATADTAADGASSAMEVDNVEDDMEVDNDSDSDSTEFLAPDFISPSLARTRRLNLVTFHNRVSRNRKSCWIWHVGDEIDEQGVQKWRCGLCSGDIVKCYTISSTCHIKRHLEEAHGFANENRLAAIGHGQSTLDRHFLFERPDPAVFKRKLVDFFLVCRLPFHVVESPYFHALFDHNSAIASMVPHCSDTLKNWSLFRHESAQGSVKTALAEARSIIHYALDCWTSSNSLPIVAIVAHFADKLGRLQKALLALRELDGILLIRRTLMYRASHWRATGCICFGRRSRIWNHHSPWLFCDGQCVQQRR